MTLSMLVPEGRVLLPVPAGSARARDLSAARLERNRFGNVFPAPLGGFFHNEEEVFVQ